MTKSPKFDYYPKFDYLVCEDRSSMIIVKMHDGEEWMPFCKVNFDLGEQDATQLLIDHLNATGYDPLERDR